MIKRVLSLFMVLFLVVGLGNFSSLAVTADDEIQSVRVVPINQGKSSVYMVESAPVDGVSEVSIYVEDFNVNAFSWIVKYTGGTEVVGKSFTSDFKNFVNPEDGSSTSMNISNNSVSTQQIIFTGAGLKTNGEGLTFTGKAATFKVRKNDDTGLLIYDGLKYAEEYNEKSFDEMKEFAYFVIDAQPKVFLSYKTEEDGSYKVTVNADDVDFSAFCIAVKYNGKLSDMKLKYSPKLKSTFEDFGPSMIFNNVTDNSLAIFTGVVFDSTDKVKEFRYSGEVATITFKTNEAASFAVYNRLKITEENDSLDYTTIRSMADDEIKIAAPYEGETLYTFKVEGGLAICGHDGTASSLTIPSDKNIVEIYDGAFSKNTALKTVVIPEGVTRIGDKAFAGCTSLTKVVIPESLTSISSNAFADCSNVVVSGSSKAKELIQGVENTVVVGQDISSSGTMITCAKNGENYRVFVNIPNITKVSSVDVLFDGVTIKQKIGEVCSNNVTSVKNDLEAGKFSYSCGLGTSSIDFNIHIGECKDDKFKIKLLVDGMEVDSIIVTATNESKQENLVFTDLENNIIKLGQLVNNKLDELKTLLNSLRDTVDAAVELLNGSIDNTDLKSIKLSNVSKIYEGAFNQCNNLSTINLAGQQLEVNGGIAQDCKNLSTIALTGLNINFADLNLQQTKVKTLVINPKKDISGKIKINPDLTVIAPVNKIDKVRLIVDGGIIRSLGDSDGDGAITSSDSLLQLKNAANLIDASDDVQRITLDSNLDGNTTSGDALDTLKNAAGLTTGIDTVDEIPDSVLLID